MRKIPDYDLGTARGRIALDASSLGRAAAAFGTLGRSLLGFSAVAVGGFAYVVKKTADFEKVMSAVKAVTEATESEMAGLRETALTMATTSAFGAEAIAGAFEDLGKAGISVDEIMGGAAEATIKLAEAAGDELPGGIRQGAEIMANALKTFGVGAEEALRFADILVGAAASSTLSVDDIATSLRYVGPVAAATGVNFEELSTALALLGDRGIKGSTAGTSLRGVLLSLNPTADKAKNALRDLGIIAEDGSNKFYDMHGNMKPLPQVMQILQDATKGLTEEQKISTFNTIFQRRAMASALIMAELGAEGFEQYADAMAGLSATDIAATKLDNLSGDMTILRNTIDALIIRAGQPFQDMLRGWVQGLTDVVRKLTELDPAILTNIIRVVAIAGVVAGALGIFSLMIGAVIKMYINFKLLAEGIKLVMGAVRLLTASLLLNPWFLLAAAIVAIGFALYKAYQRGGEFKEQWDRIFEIFRPAMDAVKNFVINFVEQFGNLIDVFKDWDDVAQGAAEVIDNMFGNTGNLVGPVRTIIEALLQLDDVVKSVWAYFADNVAPAFITAGVAIARFGQTVVRWLINTGIPAVVSFAETLIEYLTAAFNWIDEHIMPAVSAFAELIVAVFERIQSTINTMKPLFNTIADSVLLTLELIQRGISLFIQVVQIAWDLFGDNILSVIMIAFNAIKLVVESALKIITGVFQVFTGIFSGDWSKAWQGIKNILAGIWDVIKAIPRLALDIIFQVIETAIDTILFAWRAGWALIKSIVSAAWEIIKRVISTAMENARTVVRDKLNAVMDFFRNVRDRVKTAIGDVASLLYNKGRDIVTGLFNGIKALFEAVKTWFIFLPSKILTALGNVGSMLYNAGKAIIQGLINGIGSMIGAVGDKVRSVVGTITRFLPGSPVKEGPLKVLNRGYAGKQIVQMVLDGMTADMTRVAKAYQGLTTIPTITPAISPVSSSTVNNAPSLTFNFPGITSGEDANLIKKTLNDPNVLMELTRSIKAGVGRV